MKTRLGIVGLLIIAIAACGDSSVTVNDATPDTSRADTGPCTPQAAGPWCSAQGKDCGDIPDSCNTGTVNCGQCAPGQLCGIISPNECFIPVDAGVPDTTVDGPVPDTSVDGPAPDVTVTPDTMLNPDGPSADTAPIPDIGVDAPTPDIGVDTAVIPDVGVDSAVPDTTSVDSSGVSCQQATDCFGGEICDPQTGTCVVAECSTTSPACPAGELCLIQNSDPTLGACYTDCTPFVVGCPAGEDCRPLTFDNQFGACLMTDTPTQGQPCSPTEIGSGCAAGLLCVELTTGSPTCEPVCDYWDSVGPCAGTDRCEWFGTCGPDNNPTISATPLGQVCVGASGGEQCGNDGVAFRGTCLDTGGGTFECIGLCRSDFNVFSHQDCGAGDHCVPSTVISLGLCLDCAVDIGAVDCTECNTLIFSSNGCCEGVLNTCQANQDCVDLFNCVVACNPGDTACLTACETSFPGGVTDLTALLTCGDQICGSCTPTP